MDLDDIQKSVLLARAMGLFVSGKTFDQWDRPFVLIHPDRDDWEWMETASYPVNLYDPANMALANKVIFWGYGTVKEYQTWIHKPGTAIAILIGAGGFQLALDRLLYLLIEADLVAEEEKG